MTSDNFMKGFWEGLGWTSLAIFVFFPWMLGFVDGMWLFLAGSVLTSVPWDFTRIMSAVCWPFFCGMIAAGMS